ncbi:DUF3089 domain-containing protein [Parapedomonas caeni]
MTATAPSPRRIAPSVKFLWLVAGLILLAVLGWVAYHAFAPQLMRMAFVPKVSFAESELAPAPDYADPAVWVAMPGHPGPSQDVPAGYRAAPRPQIDVFYVPPTTFLKNSRWNAPLDDAETNERTDMMVRHQASVFNGVGQIWAPRYRHAAFGAFLSDQPADVGQALAVAYTDVQAAFDAYLAASGSRPFILAGHSQGSLHALALLKDRIASQPLVKPRLVAAYLVGWPISSKADLEPLGLEACATPAATGCVLSWQSFGEPADVSGIAAVYNATRGASGIARAGTPMVCVNPLSGWADSRRVDANANLGALAFSKPDEPLGPLEAEVTGATCQSDGFLHLTHNPDAPYDKFLLPGENYHVYDYALFWANIRANAQMRVEAYFGPRRPLATRP